MTISDTPVNRVYKGVIATAVTPVLKAAGFRKTGLSYHRRRGSTTQVVNIQGSQWSSGDEKRFYVNVGVSFDTLCELAGIPILEKPKEYECDTRGFRHRLEAVIAEAPASWTIHANHDESAAVVALRACLQQLVDQLEGIDGPASFRTHAWFDRFKPTDTNAKILYVLGDCDGADREVDAIVARFADRGLSRSRLLARLGLPGLEGN
jgi:hypothetical protein